MWNIPQDATVCKCVLLYISSLFLRRFGIPLVFCFLRSKPQNDAGLVSQPVITNTGICRGTMIMRHFLTIGNMETRQALVHWTTSTKRTVTKTSDTSEIHHNFLSWAMFVHILDLSLAMGQVPTTPGWPNLSSSISSWCFFSRCLWVVIVSMKQCLRSTSDQYWTNKIQKVCYCTLLIHA